jgi:hypothetical protein
MHRLLHKLATNVIYTKVFVSKREFGDSFVLIIIFGLILMSVEEPPTISALSLAMKLLYFFAS